MTEPSTELCLQPVNGDQRCQLLADHLVPCSPDPDGGWITIPSQPWNEIAPRLYQGGSVWYDNEDLEFFDVVLTVNGKAKPAPRTVMERRFYMTDSAKLPDLKQLSAQVDWVYQQWQADHRRILVRCQAGLNRSGLVVALVLYKHGYDIENAIELIRSKRSPYALCNRYFVEYLRGLL